MNRDYTYVYNDDGIRVSKEANGTIHTYYVTGSLIIAEKRTSAGQTDKLQYYYDSTGVCGFSRNGTQYYYQKNLQGDIVMVYNSNGVIKARYIYDAWGKCNIILDTDGIGTLNPYRYRSYYYDNETGLYYLNSRYYDPQVGRFLNADDIGVATAFGCGIINGLNLYSYCFNDPINCVDYAGNWPQPFRWKGWDIRFDPPRAGKGQQYHVHVDGYGQNFAQNLDGSAHDGLEGVPPKGVRDEIYSKTHGKWKWKVNKISYSPRKHWNEQLNIPVIPRSQEQLIIPNLSKWHEQLIIPYKPRFIEQLLIPNKQPWREGIYFPDINFPSVMIDNTTLAYGGMAILIIVLLFMIVLAPVGI